MSSKRSKGSKSTSGGRPKRSEAERRKFRVALSLTAAEFKSLEVAADADEREIATFARMVLMKTIGK